VGRGRLQCRLVTDTTYYLFLIYAKPVEVGQVVLEKVFPKAKIILAPGESFSESTCPTYTVVPQPLLLPGVAML
jgi:hypothetical protein